MLPTPQELRELLHYDQETGTLTWKTNVRNGSIRAGMLAGSITHGRRELKIGKRCFIAARVIWCIQTGAWPAAEIDHKDCDPLNNRWGNLREATRSQNQANRRMHRNNTTGFKGVYQEGKRYRVTIGEKPRRHVGYYDTPEQAHAAYLQASLEMYGPFARSK
jgi:hypothetical protein